MSSHPAPLAPFADASELIEFAWAFVGARTNSLRQDLAHCLGPTPGPAPGTTGYAPFPGILYCFSTVDLLGALYAGDARRRARTTDNSAAYMRDLMHYTDEQVRLLQRVFRHKLVHLAQPHAVIEDEGRHIRWHYFHEDHPSHLQVVPLQPPVQIDITRILRLEADHELVLSVARFVDEIVASAITPPDSYMHRLQNEEALRVNFATAIGQIFDPAQ